MILQTKRLDAKRRTVLWAGLALVTAGPIVVLRGVATAAWTLPADAVFLVGLLLGAGLTVEAAARIPDRLAYRAAAAMAVAAGALQIWVNLAIGIIGSEDEPANLLFAVVVAVALLGSAAARLRPRGMARAMAAAAAAQIAAFAVAAIAGIGFVGPITVFFTTLWLTSAWLFARAAPR